MFQIARGTHSAPPVYRGRVAGAVTVVGLVWLLCSAAASQELTFGYFGTYKDNELWREICEGFEAAHPGVRVKRMWSVGDLGQKIHLQMITGTAPDVLQMDDEIFPTYSVRGYLEDLRPYIERAGDAIECELGEALIAGSEAGGVFLPTSLESFNYDGFQGGLPWCGNVVLMFYNKDLFDRAGIPYPHDDWTMADYRAIAKRLTCDTDGDGRIDQFGASLLFSLLGVEHFVWSFGGEILDEDKTRCLLNEPRALEALQFLYDMKYVDRSIAWTGQTEGFATDVQLLTGRLGIVSIASHFIPMLNRVKDGHRWGVAHMPIGPHGHRYTRATWDGLSIFAHTTPEKKELAWKFTKYVIDRESQGLIGRMQRGLPIRREQAITDYAGGREDGGEHIALEATYYSRLTPITPRYLEMREAMTGEFNRLNAAEHTKATPPDVTPVIAAKVDAVLARQIAAFSRPEGDGGHEAHGMGSALKSLAFAALLIAGLAVLLALIRPVRQAFLDEVHQLRRAFRSPRSRLQTVEGVLFAAPWLIGFAVFTAFPIVFSIVLSFSEWDPYTPFSHMEFVGLANFRKALSRDPLTGDPLVFKALYNTFYYALFAVPLGLGVSLGLAILLNQKVRGITVFRTVFYLPSIVAGVATVILWMYILNPTYGPLNTVLRGINDAFAATGVLAFIRLPEPQWLSDPAWAKPALILMSLWGAGGAGMLVFLAGLQGVPDQLYEAAELDGASRLRQFWNVTLPMLTPTIYFNLIMGIIGALKVFLQAYVLTEGSGGVDHTLLFYVLHLYNKAFVEYQMGYASALAWILFVIILGLTMLVIRSSAMWVYYEGERRR